MTQAAATDYKLLESDDGIVYAAEPLYPASTSNSKDYPGNRRQLLHTPGPPKGSILVKTGGNALMAVDETVAGQPNIVNAVVPPGKGPGDTILVQCPYSHQVFSTTIPEGVGPGQVLLVQTPPLDATFLYKQQSTILDNGGNVVPSREYDDLKLAAEVELERRHFSDE
ncbi:hypothetical protein IV203_002917 [Nitzschia inconspicua]|uniref:Uncharacterized protein n=1 Tax=Nitzschia inconspicua TaxID=303405 RepID=A0A9K3PN69_9STRA|nr:hypothetical protein IV203_002917 [Nitzschia inconspicua]